MLAPAADDPPPPSCGRMLQNNTTKNAPDQKTEPPCPGHAVQQIHLRLQCCPLAPLDCPQSACRPVQHCLHNTFCALAQFYCFPWHVQKLVKVFLEGCKCPYLQLGKVLLQRAPGHHRPHRCRRDILRLRCHRCRRGRGGHWLHAPRIGIGGNLLVSFAGHQSDLLLHRCRRRSTWAPQRLPLLRRVLGHHRFNVFFLGARGNQNRRLLRLTKWNFLCRGGTHVGSDRSESSRQGHVDVLLVGGTTIVAAGLVIRRQFTGVDMAVVEER